MSITNHEHHRSMNIHEHHRSMSIHEHYKTMSITDPLSFVATLSAQEVPAFLQAKVITLDSSKRFTNDHHLQQLANLRALELYDMSVTDVRSLSSLSLLTLLSATCLVPLYKYEEELQPSELPPQLQMLRAAYLELCELDGWLSALVKVSVLRFLLHACYTCHLGRHHGEFCGR
jgi:hypothetical protein